MKKISILLISTLLLLTSCAPNMKEDELLQNDETANQERSIVPNYQLSKDNYKMILPYRASKARGVIVNQLANRLDIDEVETGLRRLSTEYFDPEKYYFEEGQYLTKDMVYEWLGRALTKKQLEEAVQKEIARLTKEKMTVNEEKIRASFQQGLNPPIVSTADKEEQEENPRYLSHVLEQNFLQRKDDKAVELVGISIGLALKSVYRFQTEIGGPYYYEKIPKKEMLEYGEKVAAEVLQRIRQIDGLNGIPIMIALYREEEQGSPVPGSFVSKTYVQGGSTAIGKWENIDEENILFPSETAKEKYFEEYQIVKSFGDEIAQYFPNYVGVVGEGFYVNKELKKLTIEIPIEFYGKGEIVGFTQYAYGLVKEMFQDYYDLEINIKSSHQMESFIYREAGQKEPSVHIFH